MGSNRTMPLLSAVILAGAMLFLAPSCIMYRPQSVDVPLIHHKEDLRVDAAFSLTPLGFAPALNATGSYGLTDWNALQFHINWDGYKTMYTQASVGAYKTFGGHFVTEAYLGYGFGYSCYQNHSDSSGSTSSGSSSSTINYTKKYAGAYHLPHLQLNAGWVDLIKGHLDLGVGLKSGVMFPNFKEEHVNSDPVYHDAPCPLLEPQAFLRVGSHKLKLTLRVGFCTFFDNASFGYVPMNASVGLNYRF